MDINFIDTDTATLKKMQYLFETANMLDATAIQTARARDIILNCAIKGYSLKIQKDRIQHPGSPLPSNYYCWIVSDKNGEVVEEFCITRSIWPKSTETPKAREFLEFYKKVVRL